MFPEPSSPFDLIGPGAVFASKTAAPPALAGDSLWFVFQGDRLIVAERGERQLPILAHADSIGLHPTRRQYLGCWGEGDEALHCFSGELDAEAALPAGLTAVDLRGLFGLWDDRWIGVAGRAKQVVHWERDHQYCGRCGLAMDAAAGERARRCPKCGLTSYHASLQPSLSR